jgi:hypothetical protein
MVGKDNSYKPEDSDVMVCMDHIRPVTNVYQKSTPQWTTKKLDEFNGDYETWLSWKECAKAYFAQCGLYQVITNADYASAHPEMNAAVHGMLTISFSGSKENYMLFSTIAFAGDGHGAWENLCRFYECSVMTDIQIANYVEKFNLLEVTTVGNFFSFVTEFLLYKDKLEGLYEKQSARNIAPKIQVLSDWNLLFFQKLKVVELESRAENLRKDDHSIEHSVKQLLDYIVEKKLLSSAQKSNGYNANHHGKGKQGDNNNKGSHQSSYKAAGNSHGSNGGGNELSKLIGSETNPEAKRLLQSVADLKKPTHKDNNAKRPHGGGQGQGQGNNGKGRSNYGNKRSRRAAAAAIHNAKSSPVSSNLNREDY